LRLMREALPQLADPSHCETVQPQSHKATKAPPPCVEQGRGRVRACRALCSARDKTDINLPAPHAHAPSVPKTSSCTRAQAHCQLDHKSNSEPPAVTAAITTPSPPPPPPPPLLLPSVPHPALNGRLRTLLPLVGLPVGCRGFDTMTGATPNVGAPAVAVGVRGRPSAAASGPPLPSWPRDGDLPVSVLSAAAYFAKRAACC